MKKLLALLMAAIMATALVACSAAVTLDSYVESAEAAMASAELPEYMTVDVYAEGDDTFVIEYTIDVDASGVTYDEMVASLEAADQTALESAADADKEACTEIQTYSYRYYDLDGYLMAQFDF
ncbi:MAG: hypothetical protein R3Y33_05655 [Clostridia bacterium]